MKCVGGLTVFVVQLSKTISFVLLSSFASPINRNVLLVVPISIEHKGELGIEEMSIIGHRLASKSIRWVVANTGFVSSN